MKFYIDYFFVIFFLSNINLSKKKTFCQTWMVLRQGDNFLMPNYDTAFIYIRKRFLNIIVFSLCMMYVCFFCFVLHFPRWNLNWFDMSILEPLEFNWFYK